MTNDDYPEFVEGREAFKNNVPRENNPYKDGGWVLPFDYLWDCGWEYEHHLACERNN